jgi:hypothetical protein
LVFVAALLLLSSAARAQTPADPSGHWDGAIQTPAAQLRIEVDLLQDRNGDIAGTMSVPGQNIKGLRLLKVAVEGPSIRFSARKDQTFSGTLSADGKSMSGNLTMNAFGLPFSLSRTGDPRIYAPITSASIRKELEGTWAGTVDANGMPLRIVLTMSNRPDGTATGLIVNLDEGELEIPVTITQTAASVTLDANAVPGSFSGTLNPEATELVGTWTEGPIAQSVTFRRAAPPNR